MSRAIAPMEGRLLQDDANADLAIDSIPDPEPLDSSTATVSAAAIASTAFGCNTPPYAFGIAAPGVSFSSPVFGFSTYCSTSSAFGVVAANAFGSTAPAFGFSDAAAAVVSTAPAFGFSDAAAAFGNSASAFGVSDAAAAVVSTAPAVGVSAASTAPTFVHECHSSIAPFKTPFALRFADSLIGKHISLYLDTGGLVLPPAGQRLQIMRQFDLINASSGFSAQRLPSIKRQRKEQLPPLGHLSTQFSPHVPVRMMFGLVATACHLLSIAPGDKRLTDRATSRCTGSIMERVTRVRVNGVKVLTSCSPALFVVNPHCSKLPPISRFVSRNHTFQFFILYF
jgi:hypothetical protein